MTIYQMAINNIAVHLKSYNLNRNNNSNDEFNIFAAAKVLSVAFAKRNEDVINDILAAQNHN